MVIDKAVAPTCENTGLTEGSHCTKCDYKVAQEVVPATGHATEVEYWTYGNNLYLVPVCGCLTEKALVDTTNALSVSNEADLVYLLTHGFDVKLDADIDLTATIDIEGAIVTLDLNGKTLKADWESDGVVEVIHVHDASHLTIVGEGNVISGGTYTAETNSVISCRVYSMLTIKGGNYYSASCGDVIFCETSSIVEIEGGHFEAAEDYYGTWYVLDIDETETYNRGQFVVTGGTFVNFDPANHSCDADYTNKLADGYHSIKGENNVYTVSAHSHTSETTAPTCTADGYTTYTCVCGDTYTEEGEAATGHNYVAGEGKDATCTETGLTAGSKCSKCGDVEAEQEEIPALNHDMVPVEGKPATCTEPGYTAYTDCSRCDHIEGKEVITAKGHKDVDAADHICDVCEEKISDCADSNEDKKCDTCGKRMPVEKTSTLTFDANKANRVSFSTASQVWSANGITFTNNKSASTNNVADYTDPVRLYKSSDVIIEATGMTKIVFKCSASDYVLNLSSTSDYTVTKNGTTVTVTFKAPVDSFTISKLANQTRFSSIDVTTLTEAPTLESITAEGMNTTYSVGDDLSLEGLVVKATLSDGTINVLEEGDYTVDTSAVNSAVAGTYTIVISYNDGFDTREVEVTVEYKAATVTGITVSGMKTEYYTGETVNTNVTITATYSDGTTGTLALTEFDIDASEVNNKVGGTYSVVFTYINDETITYTVQVTYTERTLTEVIALADGTAVVVTGTVVTIDAAYNEGYNNISVHISDNDGKKLSIYRLTGNVEVGQIIRVSGTITTYGGARQIAQGATFELIGTHECSKWTDATCSSPAKCIVCGVTKGDKLPHNLGPAATCEDNQICEDCEEVIVEALGHDYENGVCNNCGEAEPSEGEEPGVIAGGRDDFATVGTNTGYGTRTSTNKWSATNAAVIQGGTTDSSPTFKFVGSTNATRAFVLNGKKTAAGILTSPTLTTGISKLTFNYGLPFSDTKIGLKVTVTEVATGKTYTKTISNTSASKLTAYTFEWELETPIVGEFTIKIENTSPSQNTGNKDRTAIWNIVWDGWGY